MPPERRRALVESGSGIMWNWMVSRQGVSVIAFLAAFLIGLIIVFLAYAFMAPPPTAV